MRRVLSFDLDNCVFHRGYYQNVIRSPMDVININRVLFDSIKADSKNYSELIVMLGSARQSEYDDRYNSKQNKTESGFTALQKISDYLNARLDPFLLADVYGNTPDGTSFNNAINPSYEGIHANWTADDSKITILYAQIHKIALLYPEEKIVFDFYDDRGRVSWIKLDVLEHIETYFTRYPSMLPTNVTLRLHHYEDGLLNSYEPIEGTGLINKNYRQVVKDMTRLAKQTAPAAKDLDFISQSVFHVTPEQLDLQSRIPCDYIYNCFSFCFFSTTSEKAPDEKKVPLLTV